MQPIQNKVMELIKSSHLSQNQIATQCGVTRASVQNWQRRGKITKENLIKLCEIHGLGINEFLELDNATQELKPLQAKAINIIKTLADQKYYKLEEVIRLLEED